MGIGRSAGVLLGLLLAVPAMAQQAPPKALVLRSAPYTFWEGSCPGGGAIEAELTNQGIAYVTANAAAFATADLSDYNMIFLASCQDDAAYNAWNARMPALTQWVDQGGFLGVHATRDCTSNSVQPLLPGAPPTRVIDHAPQGNVLLPNHPVLLGLASPAVGSSLSHDAYSNTGDPTDIKLLTSVNSGNTLLFERQWGHGTIIYGGLTYSFYTACGGGGLNDAGRVLQNEITWGKGFTLCGTVDSDGDGVGDDCDACPGFDDNLDFDEDGVPDACDPCPHLPEPSDLNFNGICDDVDDSDDDGIPDAYDVCPGHDDNLDADTDGIPDGCDNCPFHPDPDQYDGDGDGYGIPCDCDDANPSVHPGADEYCNGIDDDCDGVVDGATALDAQTWWVDADGDGHGDVFSATVTSCEPPLGYVSRGGDCNDADVTIHPDAVEKCDDIDQNCDGDPLIEGCPRDELSGGCNTTPSPLGFAGVALAMSLVVRRRRSRE